MPELLPLQRVGLWGQQLRGAQTQELVGSEHSCGFTEEGSGGGTFVPGGRWLWCPRSVTLLSPCSRSSWEGAAGSMARSCWSLVPAQGPSPAPAVPPNTPGQPQPGRSLCEVSLGHPKIRAGSLQPRTSLLRGPQEGWVGRRGPSTAGAPSVREANAAWGRFPPAGATLSLNAIGGSGSTSSVGCETPLFGDHPPPPFLVPNSVINAPKQEAD